MSRQRWRRFFVTPVATCSAEGWRSHGPRGVCDDAHMRLRDGYDVGEQLAADPLVWSVPEFLTDIEREHIIEIARPRLDAAKVTSTRQNTTSTARTGSVAWVRYDDSEIVRGVVDRVGELVGIPVHHSESMQVVHYAETQEYRPHFDGWRLDTEKGRLRTENGGQRVLTALMYLNKPTAGGGTSFPKLELEVEAEPGRLVIFHNIADEATNIHDASLHGGMPVTEGEKWACNLWFRARPYRVGAAAPSRPAPSRRTGGGVPNRAARRRGKHR